jgi:hypothetical protein
MKDLFETPELIPNEVQAVLDTFNEDADSYQELSRLVSELEPLGYTFDYYLDAVPYGLRPIGVELEDLETYPIVNCLDCGHPQPLLEENVHVDELGRHMVCEECEASFNIGD